MSEEIDGTKSVQVSDTPDEIPEEIPVEIRDNSSTGSEPHQPSRGTLLTLISEQKTMLENYEEKLKRSLADFDNLRKKTAADIERGVNNQVDRCFLDFLQIYDDFLRAKDSFDHNNVDTKGLDSILKNMESFLAKYNVTPIEAQGKTFDPNFHEAISIASDSELDENIITKEIRKGYISHNRVIRPTLVEISKGSD